MKKKRYPVVNIGTASILTIFVILAMVAFAALTYMTARKDARFSQQEVAAAESWFGAVAQANQKIAAYNQTLIKSYENGTLGVQVGEEYFFSIPCDSDTELSVTLLVCDPADTRGTLYQITRFQQINTKEWSNQEPLHLMDLSLNSFQI